MRITKKILKNTNFYNLNANIKNMCEFISWIERKEGLYYLTAKDIPLQCEGTVLAGCKDNDFLGHGAIRLFFGLDLKQETVREESKENRNFWEGTLPAQIKSVWNAGELDGLLKYLQQDDINYIVEHAPPEISCWSLRQRFASLDDMKKDNLSTIRIFGYLATRDLAGMRNDADQYVRDIGHATTEGYERMRASENPWLRLFSYVAATDVVNMKRPVLA